MSFFQAIFLGLIQGITEFLPVSSSGHLAIAQSLLPGFSQPGLLFDILLHVGTMVAVLCFFRREILQLIVSPFNRTDEGALHRRILYMLILASIPTAVIGLTFKDFFEGLFHNLTVVASMLLVTGTLLFVAEKARKEGRQEGELTWTDALVVGTVQGFAIIPGISRSGSTIAALLLKGVNAETAARFSFLLALPAVFGAALLSLGDLQEVTASEIPAYLAGTLVAFGSGLLSIRFLMGVIRRKRLIFFSAYCWGAGGLLLVLSLSGIL